MSLSKWRGLNNRKYINLIQGNFFHPLRPHLEGPILLRIESGGFLEDQKYIFFFFKKGGALVLRKGYILDYELFN